MTHIVYPQTIACSANNTKLKFFFSASLPGLCLALNISAQSTPSSCLPSPPGTGNSQSVLNIKYHIQIVRYSINQNDIRDANNGFNTRLVPVAIVVFRYLMVCHAVSCQNLGGERPLWRVVSWWWWFWFWFWCWWCCWNILKMFLDGPYVVLAWWRAAPSLVHPKFWWWQWCWWQSWWWQWCWFHWVCMDLFSSDMGLHGVPLFGQWVPHFLHLWHQSHFSRVHWQRGEVQVATDFDVCLELFMYLCAKTSPPSSWD